MTLQSRPYSDDHLPQLQDVLAGWTQAAGPCGYSHTGFLPHMIYETLRGRTPAGERVRIWEDAGGIAGIAINGLFDTSFLLFARPNTRGSVAEIEMLQATYQAARRHLTAAEGPEISVNTDVYSCDTPRRELLEGLGFSQHCIWDHITMRLLSETIPELHIPDGFIIRTATPDDAEQLALVRNEAFSSDWTGEQFRTIVMQKPGYRPEWEVVAVAGNGQIAASTVVRLDQINKVGLFEPVGTRPAFQRRGLARAIMISALHEMKRQGMESARVEHGADNSRAHQLYTSLGFQKKYETLGYQRV
jgi:mycothiol synthase